MQQIRSTTRQFPVGYSSADVLRRILAERGRSIYTSRLSTFPESTYPEQTGF